jgi:ribonuclease D
VQYAPTILDTSKKLKEGLRTLEGSLAVDTEFHAERRFSPELMWIQIADSAGRCVLVDAQVAQLLAPTVEFLGTRDLILHAGHHDLALLSPFGAINPGRVFDTQLAAGLTGSGYPINLGKILEKKLKLKISKAQGLSDWSSRPLKPDQIVYAAEDVLHLHALKESLSNQECSVPMPQVLPSLLEENLAVPPDNQLWKGFRAAVILDDRGREVLRRTAVWRNNLAKEENRQPRQICSDGALVDLAKRKPRTIDSLAAPRNFSKKVCNLHGTALLSCIEEAFNTPTQDLPLSLQMGLREQAISALLAAWAHHLRERTGIDIRLLLPDTLRAILANMWANGIAPQLPPGWRKESFQADLSDLYEGRYQTGPNGLQRT